MQVIGPGPANAKYYDCSRANFKLNTRAGGTYVIVDRVEKVAGIVPDMPPLFDTDKNLNVRSNDHNLTP